jgi:DHA1 family tetracycline resistance protein-like MFS transporter
MGRKKLYILCGCVLPLMICSGLVYSMFSLYMGDVLGAPRTQIGLIYMVGSAVGLIFSPLLGKISDRFGRKPVILGTMDAFATIFVLYYRVQGYMPVYGIQLLEAPPGWASALRSQPTSPTSLPKTRGAGLWASISRPYRSAG